MGDCRPVRCSVLKIDIVKNRRLGDPIITRRMVWDVVEVVGEQVD